MEGFKRNEVLPDGGTLSTLCPVKAARHERITYSIFSFVHNVQDMQTHGERTSAVTWGWGTGEKWGVTANRCRVLGGGKGVIKILKIGGDLAGMAQQLSVGPWEQGGRG